jgi:hypothetical protein
MYYNLGMAKGTRLAVCVFLAVAMTVNAIAASVCVTLCDLRACCPVAEQQTSHAMRSCCEKHAKPLPAKASGPKKCCEWIGKSSAPDQFMSKVWLAVSAQPIILPERIVLPEAPIATFQQKPIQYYDRGPPGCDPPLPESRGPPVLCV